jgi:predicted nucleotidyltransferase component of viral defense system
MISKNEIMQHARQLNLSPNIVEKDYILNWILAGISHQKELNQAWIFKGGTCLKKCFFENYRFSEDLDFTLLESQHLDESFLLNQFSVIAEWVYAQRGIEIPSSGMSFEIYKNNRGSYSVEGRIGYRGPLQRKNNMSRIKIDLTDAEVVVLEPELRTIYHPYSDTLDGFNKIQTYSFDEIFAEKLRALTERLRPRDLYDVICLYYDGRWKADRDKVHRSLKKKCEYKNIAFPTLISLQNNSYKGELISEWENMLAHQISNLPSFDYYWQQLPEILDWIHHEQVD